MGVGGLYIGVLHVTRDRLGPGFLKFDGFQDLHRGFPAGLISIGRFPKNPASVHPLNIDGTGVTTTESISGAWRHHIRKTWIDLYARVTTKIKAQTCMHLHVDIWIGRACSSSWRRLDALVAPVLTLGCAYIKSRDRRSKKKPPLGVVPFM